MDIQQYKIEISTLKPFFDMHCKNHIDKTDIDIYYDDTKIDEIKLCDKCSEIFLYATQRLRYCQQSPKPKCRKCKNNCFEKDMYKKIAKIMAFSGIKLGVSKIISKKKFE